MHTIQKGFRVVVLTLWTLLAGALAGAQDRVLVPSTATGGFGEASACHTAMVPAIAFSGPQTVVINAAGRVRFGNPSYAVPPDGIAIGENKNFGALVGAFVEQGRAGDAAFEPVSEDLASWGIPSSSLFLIGNGPYRFEASGPGTLFLGINAGDVCGTTGSFSVSVTVPVKIIGYSGGSLTIRKAAGGAIPVAILSSATFDALKVNPASLSLAAGRLRLFATGDPSSCHAADANADGLPDLMCQFRSGSSLIESSAGLAVIEGRTANGMPIRGETAISIAP